MWGLSDIARGASSLYHSAADTASRGVHTVSEGAANAYHGAVGLSNTASGYIQRAEGGITRGLHAAEDWVDHGTHAIAARAAGVPVLGTVARAGADMISTNAQVVGGALGGAATLVGGIANAALHPIDTASGIEAMAEHAGGPLGTVVRGGHDLIDVVRGRRSVGSMVERATNPLATMHEDQQFWGRMGSAIIDPFRASVREGRYGEAVGRGMFDIGSMLIGAGEVGDAARGAGAAGEVGRSAALTDAARGAELATDGSRAIRTSNEATAATRVAGDGAEVTHTVDLADAVHAPPSVHEPANVGLADRGYRPQPGERSTTREQWRRAEHDRRTAESVRDLDDHTTGAHGYGDHGAQTTNPQHTTRVQTGVTPSGRTGPRVARATRFDTPELQLEANGRARRLMNRDAPTTPTTRVNAHGTDMPNDVGYVVEGPRGGYGSGVEVQRGPANPTTGQPGAPLPGRPTQPTQQQPRAQVYFRYNPATSKWEPRTSYPTDLPQTP